MIQTSVKNYACVIVGTIALSSCAGVTNHGSISLNEEKNSFAIQIKSKHHEFWFDPDNDRDAQISAWVTNCGNDNIETFHSSYKKTYNYAESKIPFANKKIVLIPGKKTLFFDGPISLLGMSFNSLPEKGVDLYVEISFDNKTFHSIRGKLLSSYGGP